MQVPKPNHKRRVPKQSKRNEFSRKTRKAIVERAEGYCESCGTIGQEIHHCWPRARSGRGVESNGVLLCSSCHKHLHNNPYEMRKWQRIYEERYGVNYFMDDYDMAELESKRNSL